MRLISLILVFLHLTNVIVSEEQFDTVDSEYAEYIYRTNSSKRIQRLTDEEYIVIRRLRDSQVPVSSPVSAPYPVHAPSSSDEDAPRQPVRQKKKEYVSDSRKKKKISKSKLKKGGKGKGGYTDDNYYGDDDSVIVGKGKGGYDDDNYVTDDDTVTGGKGTGKGIPKKKDNEGKGKGKGKGGGVYDDDEFNVGGKGKGKGKGKGGGGGGGGGYDDDNYGPTKSPSEGESGCKSSIAIDIESNVKRTIAINPSECCSYDGPIAAYVTHAIPDPTTASGFEPFWDAVYNEIELNSIVEGVCYVFVGVDSDIVNSELSTLLIKANLYVSSREEVVAMMVTDPTASVELITTIRSISEEPGLPSIGVFNAGYPNIIIESVVSGKGRLQYVGYLNDKDYGQQAARISLNLLDGLDAVPLCFNSRIGTLDFVGERCAAYYDEITENIIDPIEGIRCSSSSDVGVIYDQIVSSGANAVWSHVDCCAVVADAVELARGVNSTATTIVVGCQDNDTSGGKIDFVTTQPVTLQAYSASSWANFPVQQSKMGKNGRLEQYFPFRMSVVNTAIFNVLIK